MARDLVARVLMLAVVAIVAQACAGDDAPPTRLADGSEAMPPPVALDGLEHPAILSAAYAPRTTAFQRARQSCVRFANLQGSTVAGGVLRVGAVGASVTLAHRSGIYACDSGGTEASDSWCGSAFGRLVGGRLRDPRLDVLCRDGDDPLGFAWIQPGQRARYVVVEQGSHAEAYEVLDRLPVRVTTREVDRTASGATFDVSEHDARGRLLRSYRLEAVVAG